MEKNYKVTVLAPANDPPKDFEISAAFIMAKYFKKSIIFQRTQILRTPDFIIDGQIWELKSPTGNGKNTIHNNFKSAREQSVNIILDLRRCRMNEAKAIARIREAYNKRRRKTGSFLIINKRGRVLEISDIL